MSRILNLYPTAWQERYRDEMMELLAEHPPTWRDRFDLALGALDARLHPQVQRRPDPIEDDGLPLRTIAVTVGALLGGGLWIVGGLALKSASFGADGYREAAGPTAIFAVAAFVSALAAIALAGSSRTRRRSAVAMLVIAPLILLPWPIMFIGFFGTAFATAAYGVALVREESGPVGTVLAVTALVLTAINTEDERALLTIPLGLAWLAVGAIALLRRWPAPIRARGDPR
jgi:hypothetical protein